MPPFSVCVPTHPLNEGTKAEAARHSSCTRISFTVISGGVYGTPWSRFRPHLHDGAHRMECENTPPCGLHGWMGPQKNPMGTGWFQVLPNSIPHMVLDGRIFLCLPDRGAHFCIEGCTHFACARGNWARLMSMPTHSPSAYRARADSQRNICVSLRSYWNVSHPAALHLRLEAKVRRWVEWPKIGFWAMHLF